ncbi:MAG: hypothetical protein WD876_02195 [Candidatus Pacearchaeota archaeon]
MATSETGGRLVIRNIKQFFTNLRAKTSTPDATIRTSSPGSPGTITSTPPTSSPAPKPAPTPVPNRRSGGGGSSPQQLGQVLVTPQEFQRLSPREQAQAQVVSSVSINAPTIAQRQAVQQRQRVQQQGITREEQIERTGRAREIGKPFVTPDEAQRLSDVERERVEIISETPTLERTTERLRNIRLARIGRGEERSVASAIIGQEGEDIVGNMGVQFPTLFPADTPANETITLQGTRTAPRWFGGQVNQTGVKVVDNLGNIIRDATPAESQEFRSQTGVYQASTGSTPYSTPGRLKVAKTVNQAIGPIQEIFVPLKENVKSKFKGGGSSVMSFITTTPIIKDIANYIQTKTTLPTAYASLKTDIKRFDTATRVIPAGQVQEGYPLPIFPASNFASVSRVGFVGVTQRVDQNIIITQAGYKLVKNRGPFSTAEIGGVKAVSQITKADDFDIITTVAKGQRVGSNKPFASLEVSAVKQRGSEFISVGSGKYVSNIAKDSKALYSSLTYGKAEGDLTASIGVSQSRAGKVYSAGLLKETTQPRNYYQIIGGSSKLDMVKSIALSQVQTSVQTSVQSAASVSKVPGISSLVSAKQFTQTQTKITQPLKITTQINRVYSPQSSIQFTPQTQTLSFAPAQRTRQRSGQVVSLASLQRTLQSEATKQVSRQAQKPLQALLYRQVQRQQTRQQLKLFQVQRGVRTPTRISFTKGVGLSLKKFYPLTKQTIQSNLLPVFLRRFKKFRFVGYGKTEFEALEIGKKAAGTTLGATFKIPGIKTQKVAGFKTKFSKKEGKVFIELPKYRLSTATEKKEIKMFKQLKGGKKK